MYLRSVLLILPLVFLSFWGAGQSPDFVSTLGPVQDEERGMELVDVFGHGDAHFYGIYGNVRRMRKFALVKLDTDSLHAVTRTEFKMPDIKGMATYYAFAYSTDSNSYLIATAEDEETGTVFIMAFGLLEDGKVSRTPLTIGQGSAAAMNIDDGFRIFPSEDGRRTVMLIPNESDPYKNESMEVRVFDGDFSLLESATLRLPYPAGQTMVDEAVMDTSGGVHLLISIAGDNVADAKTAGITALEYSLVSYNPSDGSVNEKFLALENRNLYKAKPAINSAGNLQVAGFYGNILNLNIDGAFSLEVDPVEGNILNQGMSPFGRDFRMRFRTDVRQRKSESGKFELDEAIGTEEGGLQLISEMRYSETVTVFNPGSGTYSTIEINNFDEIMVTRIGPDGRINENILIPKYQSSSREVGKYISYVCYTAGDKTFLIFNDNERNELGSVSGGSMRALTGSGSARPIVVTIVEDDKLERRPLVTSGAPTYVLFASHHHATSSSMIVTLYSGSRIRFVKLSRAGE